MVLLKKNQNNGSYIQPTQKISVAHPKMSGKFPTYFIWRVIAVATPFDEMSASTVPKDVR